MSSRTYEVREIGRVESPSTDLASSPCFGADAWIVFEPSVLGGLCGLQAGDEILVLTWLHRAQRDVLRVHPRGDTARAEHGVFATRSPDRPNPIGLHRVRILELGRDRLRVGGLEAIDGTPVVDVKPVLTADVEDR